MPDPVAANRRLWNRWSEIHPDAAFYDVEAFRRGGSSLTPIERREVGRVEGRRLLHLQCHFGLDTLSWARLGADATGVDFSPVAVARARELAEELEIDARFVECDLFDLPDHLADERFHLVFASWGVIDWLSDLEAWARLIHRFLEPGGTFHLVEFHPLLGSLSADGATLEHPWICHDEPIEFQEEASYADPNAVVGLPSFTWAWSLGDVVQALLDAGLVLEALREFPWSPWGCFPALEEVAPGRWAVPGREDWFPLSFAVRARRPL